MDAVVKLSGHAENASNAFQSIINNHGAFNKVHLVCSYYEANVEPFKGYHDLRDELAKKGIEVNVCDSFDRDDCPEVDGDAVTEISPYCVLRGGGVAKLKKVIARLEKQKNTSAMHFGLTTTMVIPEESFRRDFWHAISGYGFLLITFYIDMWWRIYCFGKYYLESDVRTSFVCSTYNRKFIPRLSLFTRVWNNEQVASRYAGDSAVLRPESKMRGFKLARYIVNTHNKQVFGGAWLFVLMFGFYFWLAYPWWNHLTIPGASQMLLRPVFGPLNLVLYLFNAGMLYMGSSYYLILPHQALLCILFPFYLTLYPLFWIYARLYRPKDTWNIK